MTRHKEGALEHTNNVGSAEEEGEELWNKYCVSQVPKFTIWSRGCDLKCDLVVISG